MRTTGFFIAIALVGGLGATSCTRPKVVDLSKLDHPAQGAWGSLDRGKIRKGDAYLDSHEMLVKGDARGWVVVWDQARTWQSDAPGLVYQQAGSARCTVTSRALYRGSLGPKGRLRLRYDKALPREENCQGQLLFPKACSLQAENHRLTLDCGEQRRIFARRREASPSLLFALLAPGGRVSGVWTWHHRSIDREGDLKIEHETWHLFQRGASVEGFYDRVVAIRSRDGRRFLCNDDLGYRSRARFLVRGKLVGDKLMLREVSYVTNPGRCDTGRRSLDRYMGVLQSRDGEIHLRWRTGGQLLRRRR